MPFSKRRGIVAREDVVMARQDELKRLHVIQKVLEGLIRQVEAAGILSLSSRQIRRIVKRVKVEGERGIVHKSRGRPSNRRISRKIRDKVIQLYRKQYPDFGPTLASEKLLERDAIQVSDETLRRWLLESGDWKKARKSRGHRQWRQRKDHPGEMIQMDGSHHNWFEGRGPQSVLMGYIDDATGRVYARFYEYEGTIPAMDSFKRYINKYGLPLSVYLDKHTTYKSTAKPSIEDELNDVEPLSQFERALKELGVEILHAHSPQAKGRIERLFGTFQDRLVKEMRLRGIKTIEEANRFLEKYLPMYNKRFCVSSVGEDLHRPLAKGMDLNKILCIKTQRTLRNDFTIAHNRKLYQIENALSASRVMVEDRMDGSMVITHRDEPLRFKEIATRPLREKKQPSGGKGNKHPVPPSAHHPWRGFRFGKNDLPRQAPIESQI
jgi:hypothetical protein